MKWLRSLLSLFVLSAAIGIAVAPAPAQPQPVYGRGYVRPANIKALKEASRAAHAAAQAMLPRASEPKLDRSDWLGSIKNQGSCGSCWDFDGTGVVEAAFARVGKRLILSEQYTLDCVRSGGCNGDDHSTVFKHAKTHGLPTTEEYGPYRAREGQCHAKDGMTFHKIDEWAYVDPDSDIAETQKIKDCLKTYGPIGAAVAAGSDWNNYRGGVNQGRNRGINHEVIIVGWDDTLKPGKTVWKVRNSWGASWGDKGHIWMLEGADGIGTDAAYAKVEGEPPPPVPPVPPVPPGPHAPFDWFAFIIGLTTGLIVAMAVVFVLSRRKA